MENKIHNYDFLIVGAGLIGSLTAITLHKKNYKVLVIEKSNSSKKDERTLAVNANSRDFLKELGLWNKISKYEEAIQKIIIKDYLNKEALTFEEDQESMGSVVYNKHLLEVATDYIVRNKLLIKGIDFKITNPEPNQKIKFNNKQYKFKKIIMSLGKNFTNNNLIKKTSFQNKEKSFVGFFKHQNNHIQTAYEIFTVNGPLAVLPSPSKDKKLSTFIYSTRSNIKYINLQNLLKKHFKKTHGKILLSKDIYSFEIAPHLSKAIKTDYILIGDNAHSIHPVAGQGWNLGIKDIQTLIHLLDTYSIEEKEFDKIYQSKRLIENFSYLIFTNSLTSLYANNSTLNRFILMGGFKIFNQFKLLKKIFIKQAMGRLKLI